MTPLVLIVDDFADSRMMCAEYLACSGFRVAEAANGPDAIEKATTLLPDVIVMDLALPIIDGWEATRRIKASAATSHIPIVVLSGTAHEGLTESAREAGCDAFLRKPCAPETLVAKLNELLAIRSETSRSNV